MTIDTKLFQVNARFISSLLSDEIPAYEFFYINFEKSTIYVLNSYSVASFKFKFEAEEDDNLESIAINAKKFLHLACYYDTLYFRDGKFTNNEKEKFVLPIEQYMPDVEERMLDVNECNTKEFSFNNKVIKHLKNARSFVCNSDSDAFNNIFIQNSHVVATDRIKLYSATLDELDIDFTIPMKLFKLFTVLTVNDKVNIGQTDDLMNLNINESLNILYPCESSNVADKLISDEFKKHFSHDKFIKFNVMEFKEVIQFMIPLLSDCQNARIKFTIKENKLLIEAVDTLQLERSIDITETNIKEEMCFFITLENVKLVASQIQEQEVELQISEDTPPVSFRPLNNDDYVIVIAKLRE